MDEDVELLLAEMAKRGGFDALHRAHMSDEI